MLHLSTALLKKADFCQQKIHHLHQSQNLHLSASINNAADPLNMRLQVPIENAEQVTL